ncbi:MAG: threonine--tRNA ligase, partial [Neisseriaceae bacterium]|nr:threonine--tRNA ligase [Neisseriaceae bacterium]
LAPVQVVAMSISEHQADYCLSVVEELKKLGIRAIADIRSEKIGYKIREHSTRKVPYQIIVDDKEKEQTKIAVRQKGDDLGQMSVVEFVGKIQQEIQAILSVE